MPYVIAVCHQKGGVAKTTTALSLGACLAERGLEVLLIDLDPQANLTAGAGLNPETARHSMADVLLGNEPLVRVSRETSFPGLDVVPSNADMLMASQFLHLRKPYEPLMRQSLEHSGLAHYDVALVDCAPTLGAMSLTALTAANLALVPTQCEYFSMQALRAMLGLVDLVRAKTNPGLQHRLLITMFDQRGSLHKRALAVMQQHFAPVLMQTLIGVDSKLRESQLAGRPITVHAPASRGAQQYRQLAEEVLTYVKGQGQILQAA